VADGDGWVECAQGHRHWGRFGAAGLLVTAPGPPWVLLQHRAPWSHGGDSWGVPGGARHRGESAQDAAQRETVEETALDVSVLHITGPAHVVNHGTWTYTTYVALAPSRLPVTPERESIDLRWVALDDVESLPLHHAFRDAWPQLRRILP
jgi:8-oxo-dGTP pyrophosphatase MutT (NUDIX family)